MRDPFYSYLLLLLLVVFKFAIKYDTETTNGNKMFLDKYDEKVKLKNVTASKAINISLVSKSTFESFL